MKSVGGLFDRIPERSNLLLATWKASRGKRCRKDARLFAERLDEHLRELQQRILLGIGPQGHFTEFTIVDPKKRLISAPCFEDRVMHHAVMNVCEPILEKFQIYQSYACRKGKGQFVAIEQSCKYAQKYDWFLKMDVRKYFASIPRRRLLKLLANRFREERLLVLMDKLVDSWRPGETHGLPIGSLISQHFANFFLAHLDHEVKQRMKARGYVRYMDDFVVWGDRDDLRKMVDRIESYCRQDLGLELKPCFLNRTVLGMDFLGYRVFPGRAGLARKSRLRFRKKVATLEEEFSKGIISGEELQQRAECLVAWTQKATCVNFRRRVILESGW